MFQHRGQIPGLKLARSIANQRCADSCSEEVWIAPSCRSLGRWVSPMVLLGPSDDLIRGCSLAGRCLTQTLLDSIYEVLYLSCNPLVSTSAITTWDVVYCSSCTKDLYVIPSSTVQLNQTPRESCHDTSKQGCSEVQTAARLCQSGGDAWLGAVCGRVKLR